MNSIPPFRFTAPTKQQTSAAIQDTLSENLPPVLTDLISDYVYEDIDCRCAEKDLIFNAFNEVSNPEVRSGYKKLLASKFVPPLIKSTLLRTIGRQLSAASPGKC